MGVAELTIEFGDRKTKDTKIVRSLFNIVDLPLAYNGIIGRPILYEIDAAISIRRLSMKIPLDNRVITIIGDQTMSQQCYHMATKPPAEAFPLTSLKLDKQGASPEPVEQVQTLHISGDKIVRIGSKLEPEAREDVSKVLTWHSDSFASKATEIVGVDPQVASHSLNILPGAKLVIQKKRKFTYER